MTRDLTQFQVMILKCPFSYSGLQKRYEKTPCRLLHLSLTQLPYRGSIHMAGYPTWAVVRTAAEEERPLLVLLANLRRLLQIEHLSQRHPPQRQDILMQIVSLWRRPPLKSGLVTTHCREIAVMQPVNNHLLLLHTNPSRGVGMRLITPPQREPLPLLWTAIVVVLRPTCSNEQDITDLDIPSLRRRPDIDPLRLATRAQVFELNCMRSCRIVLNTLARCVASIV